MSISKSLLALTAIALGGIVAAGAHAEDAGAKTSDGRGPRPVNVYQYALRNPVDNAHLNRPPALGESVPTAVALVPLDGNKNYAYFYYAGQPVIVDLVTRSIVRVGNSK